MKRASQNNSRLGLIIGESEMKNGEVSEKDFDNSINKCQHEIDKKQLKQFEEEARIAKEKEARKMAEEKKIAEEARIAKEKAKMEEMEAEIAQLKSKIVSNNEIENNIPFEEVKTDLQDNTNLYLRESTLMY
jgi:peptidoglycan hydrolase CwlO-like protein